MTNQLKKSLSTFQLVLYGTGTIIGAGIYVLVGKVAGIAEYASPWSFLLAALVALLTGLSYAQLSIVFPKSAGEVVYADEAFSLKPLSSIIGIMLLISGIVTASTLTKGFAGYMQVLVELPEPLIILGVLFFLGLVAIVGISESVWLVGIITLLEILGLLFIIFIYREHLNLNWLERTTYFSSFDEAKAITAGAFLAFFAFVGFEDLANVAEETKDPVKSMPVAILSSIILSTLLYMAVSVVCIGVLSPEQLGQSNAPLADVLSLKGEHYVQSISIISMVAVINGALVQIIMGSRVLYGMAMRGLAPKFLQAVHSKSKTPIYATLIILVVLYFLSANLDLVNLAEVASFVILTVFTIVNLSLIKLRSIKRIPEHLIKVWKFVPYLGAILSLLMILYKIISLI